MRYTKIVFMPTQRAGSKNRRRKRRQKGTYDGSSGLDGRSEHATPHGHDIKNKKTPPACCRWIWRTVDDIQSYEQVTAGTCHEE